MLELSRETTPLAEEQEDLSARAIRESGGKVALGRASLGVSRATLYRRLQRLRGS